MLTWSHAAQTDAALFRQSGTVDERSDYVVFRSPQNPGYRWGNRLHFGNRSDYSQQEVCERLMQREFAGDSSIKHYAFSWDVANYEKFPSRKWEDAGYAVDKSDTLTMSTSPVVRESKIPTVHRTLSSEQDWEDAFECQMKVRTARWSEEAFKAYLTPKFNLYRKLSEKREMFWFGSFLNNGTQVANLGILVVGNLLR